MENKDVDYLVHELRSIANRMTMNLTPEEKMVYLSSNIAVFIASSLTLPSSAVDLPANFFLLTHSQRVGEVLCSINEKLPINIDFTLSLVNNFYVGRYRLVYEGALMAHVLSHLGACTDDIVPTSVTAVLSKVGDQGLSSQALSGLQYDIGRLF